MKPDIRQKIFDNCEEMEGPLDTSCLVWTGSKYGFGWDYGAIRYRGKMWRVHRLVYQLCVGPIPPGMQVNHECYQADCCRPEHLKLGDHQSNADDMVRHGRSLAGEAAPSSILRRDQVVEILKLANEGKQFTHLARRFGVSDITINGIAYGKIWKDVPGPRLTPPTPRPANRFRGVRHEKGKWRARLHLNGREVHLGFFGHELLAAVCVNTHIAWLDLNKPLNVIDPDEWREAGIYD